MFETYKRYFDMGLYNYNDVAAFVTSGAITPEQFHEITGKNYIPVEVKSVITEIKTELEKQKITNSLSGGLSTSRMDGIEVDIAALKGGA